MNIPPTLTPTQLYPTFPAPEADGQPVDPKQHVEPMTGTAVALGWIVLILLLLVAVATIYLFVVLLVGMAIDYFRHQRALAQLRGSAVEVTPEQFPELHRCAETLSQRLGLAKLPEIYLAEGNVLNAAAVRLAGKQVVVLVDDVVDACLRSGEPRTLTFLLGHELAHHALGHTGYVRSQISRMLRWLSRLDELSCDRIANELTGDRAVSVRALTVLLIGPQLLPYLNPGRLEQQARMVALDTTSKKAERQLSHPLLLRRLRRFID